MKAVFDLTKCSGHARCYQVDPELFDIDDSGYAYRTEIDIPAGDDEQKAHDAVEACPERAIRIS
ncbi:ferredoxin [Rhodococcus sp. NPDC056743]|uniref:ferredoxin n=1 Tax=Rhodococcus sp. NPDC056743 TaxID=3345934 RepID=UPI00366F6789